MVFYGKIKASDELELFGGFNLDLVGTAGFELATPCTPCKCATRLRYAPLDLNYTYFRFEWGRLLKRSEGLLNFMRQTSGKDGFDLYLRLDQNLDSRIEVAALLFLD